MIICSGTDGVCKYVASEHEIRHSKSAHTHQSVNCLNGSSMTHQILNLLRHFERLKKLTEFQSVNI